MTRSVSLLILTLTACGDGRPPAPTADQNRQLDEAESMLNRQANEEGPANADAPTGPSNNQN